MSHPFEMLGLQAPLVRALIDLGFESPTPVQEQAIPVLLEQPGDLVALAQTGTGKTAAFGLPLIAMTDASSRKPQGLIICPTRELCLQVSRDLENYAKYVPGIRIAAIYGGAGIEGQIKEIRDGANLIVATPGRLTDMIHRNKIDLSGIRVAVLDEADEMLNMGFREDLDLILAQTPDTKFTWLFSATMPSEVSRIAQQFMFDPIEITVGRKNASNENIEHQFYIAGPKNKYQALKRIADFHPDIFGIVFCRTRKETQQVADALIRDGYNADALHGDLSQAQRDQVMKRFRTRHLRMLVATDVAARGIDVNDVTHVIHYHLPDDLENYTHRAGRTARAGKKGVSIALITKNEKGKIAHLERALQSRFVLREMPGFKEIVRRQVETWAAEIRDTATLPDMEGSVEALSQILSDLSREDILARFLSARFAPMLRYYNDQNQDANMDDMGGEPMRSDVARFFLNLGTMDGFDLRSIKDYLAETCGLQENDVPWIGLKSSYTLLEVRKEMADAFQSGLKGQKVNDRPVRFELRTDRGPAPKSGKDQGRGGKFKKSYSNNSQSSFGGGSDDRKKRRPAPMRF
jgi:ATP-dependent RNA helicase DeaD